MTPLSLASFASFSINTSLAVVSPGQRQSVSKLLAVSLVSTIPIFTGVLVLFDIMDDEIGFESMSVNWVTFNCNRDAKVACSALLARLLLRII